jgi:hypothetical protein
MIRKGKTRVDVENWVRVHLLVTTSKGRIFAACSAGQRFGTTHGFVRYKGERVIDCPRCRVIAAREAREWLALIGDT